jgi:hypothetical protein
MNKSWKLVVLFASVFLLTMVALSLSRRTVLINGRVELLGPSYRVWSRPQKDWPFSGVAFIGEKTLRPLVFYIGSNSDVQLDRGQRKMTQSDCSKFEWCVHVNQLSDDSVECYLYSATLKSGQTYIDGFVSDKIRGRGVFFVASGDPLDALEEVASEVVGKGARRCFVGLDADRQIMDVAPNR